MHKLWPKSFFQRYFEKYIEPVQENKTVKFTVCDHRCFAKTYLSSVWEQYTICEHNYPMEGMYFEKHIEPVNDNNTQTAQFVVTVVL